MITYPPAWLCINGTCYHTWRMTVIVCVFSRLYELSRCVKCQMSLCVQKHRFLSDWLYPLRLLYRIKSKATIRLPFNLHFKAIAALFLIPYCCSISEHFHALNHFSFYKTSYISWNTHQFHSHSLSETNERFIIWCDVHQLHSFLVWPLVLLLRFSCRDLRQKHCSFILLRFIINVTSLWVSNSFPAYL